MRHVRSFLALAMILVGAIWMLQGTGWLGGSFMTGSMTWFYIGLLLVVGGLGLFVVRR